MYSLWKVFRGGKWPIATAAVLLVVLVLANSDFTLFVVLAVLIVISAVVALYAWWVYQGSYKLEAYLERTWDRMLHRRTALPLSIREKVYDQLRDLLSSPASLAAHTASATTMSLWRLQGHCALTVDASVDAYICYVGRRLQVSCQHEQRYATWAVWRIELLHDTTETEVLSHYESTSEEWPDLAMTETVWAEARRDVCGDDAALRREAVNEALNQLVNLIARAQLESRAP